MNIATQPRPAPAGQAPGEHCILVIFGASGDLTKRLLMPALYNLSCDGLLPAQFAIIGVAMDELTTDSFRERLNLEIKSFNTRGSFDQAVWDNLSKRLHYIAGKFGDEPTYTKLRDLVNTL